MKRLQESRKVEISPYGLTRGVELNLHSYSTGFSVALHGSAPLLLRNHCGGLTDFFRGFRMPRGYGPNAVC